MTKLESHRAMKNLRLKLNFSPREDPFEEDKAQDIVWGEINLDVVDTEGQTVKRVIDMTWDVKELVDWIIENEDFLHHEDYPAQYIVGGDSIAEYKDRYYENRPEDAGDDLADDILYEYSARHSIVWPMIATKTIDAFIGRRNGEYEISYYASKDENWKYNVDIEPFINDAKQIKADYDGIG